MRLLIIDATPAAGARLSRALTAHGYDVTRLDPAGYAVARAGGYDACLLVVERLADAAGRDWFALPMPTVVFARAIAPEDVVTALDAGAADVVSSPVQLAEITARLRTLTRRPPPALREPLAVGALRLDVASHRAWREQAELRLSTREFDLLEAFMREPGRVLSRESLLESVWELSDLAAETNVVDQYVGHLRRKVDRPFGTHDLETVRGLGYRLAA